MTVLVPAVAVFVTGEGGGGGKSPFSVCPVVLESDLITFECLTKMHTNPPALPFTQQCFSNFPIFFPKYNRSPC